MGGECESYGRGGNCINVLVGALVGKMLEEGGQNEIDLKEILRT